MNIGVAAALAKALGSGGSSPSGGGGLVVHESESSGVYTLDKTWKEIHDAMTEGTPVVIIRADGNDVTIVVACVYAADDEVYIVMPGVNERVYVAASQTDYPTTPPV